MSADAIYNVTQALRQRLIDALPKTPAPGNVFVGPLDDPDAAGADLILFLYRIAPNASLRNRERRVETGDPLQPVIVHTNSLPVELRYLLTVGTRTATDGDPLLKTLGHAMRALNDAPNLVGQQVGHETVQVSLDPLSTEEMSRIWTLFPTANYRTSVGYVATPVWIDPPAAAGQAARVIEDRLLAGQRAREAANA